ncbi:MAG: FAD-dependent oxidoreductase [Flavobacteriales bacterium]|nr:FAD-dependent oxidoreductase [Flavobacteriales bacterium]
MTDINLSIPVQHYEDESLVLQAISKESGIPLEEIAGFQELRRSIDSRNRKIKFNLRVRVFDVGAFRGKPLPTHHPKYVQRNFQDVSKADHVVIVGSGPAGMFAALRLIELGIKPIILERGKDVQSRRRDLAAINKEHIVNPESNYCFGEGGAGTYSDGKLYTRSTKRGNVNGILSTFIQFGANEDILVNNHPHIGTDKLPGIIAAIREQIIECGGEVRFNAKLTDIVLDGDKVVGVQINDEDRLDTQKLILATGHSARDIYELLHEKKILLEAKPFAMGVRVEHPQQMIDSLQYHGVKNDVLPPASYALVSQVEGRGVYSFCMCPGGIIAPCATSPGEIVTNGWSPSKRNNPFANSGIVVPVEPEDYRQFSAFGPLAGMKYQQSVEQLCCQVAGGTQAAPAQRLADLVANRKSTDLPKNSYQPGTESLQLSEVLPAAIHQRLMVGLKDFGEKMKGYLTNEAIAVWVESRTSSPVRIPRNDQGEHPQITGLFPCGEGAGFAGGIVSAAIDGEFVVSQMV